MTPQKTPASASLFSVRALLPAWGGQNCCCRGATLPSSATSSGNGRPWARGKSRSFASRQTRNWARNWIVWASPRRIASKIRSRNTACSVPFSAPRTGPAGTTKSPSGRLFSATSRICGWKRCAPCWSFSAGHPAAVCQPEFGGHARHPVLLPRPAFGELKQTQAKTLKIFLKQISCPLVKCPIADPGLALDLDTPEDYKQAKIHLSST